MTSPASEPLPVPRLVAGADEAGRGPVIGPLVVAAVSVEREQVLAALGVRDSKKLSPAKREALAAEIRRVASRVVVRVVEPGEIDARMARVSLNQLEVEEYAIAVREALDGVPLAEAEAFVDACDTDAARFGREVASRVGGGARVVSAHKADDRFPVVSAASIIAKTVRDARVAALAEEYGCEVGSGYPSDPVTVAFLKRYHKEQGRLPACARASWETSKRLLAPVQARLDFGGA